MMAVKTKVTADEGNSDGNGPGVVDNSLCTFMLQENGTTKLSQLVGAFELSPTTEDYIRAENKLQIYSQLFIKQVVKHFTKG